MSKESVYILKRIIKAKIQSIPFYICRIFPIDKKKIVFCCIEGTTGYSCNPKYIAEECIRRNQKKLTDFKVVWLVNDMTKSFPQEIKVFKNTLWNRAYQLTTARIWIDNSRKQLEVRKRKNQVYIQTWHAKLGFKPTGLDRGKSFSKIAYMVSKHDSDMVDYWLSNSDWYDKTLKTGSLYEGKTLRTGSPRCDILVNRSDADKQRIHDKFNLSDDTKILMYAPTFRGGSQGTNREIEAGNHMPDFSLLLKSLEKKFGGKWYVLLRLHPQLTARHINSIVSDKRLIDISGEDDMYEILAGCDAFMTDYSSAAFDAMVMKIPIFLYCDDYHEYEGERGKLLWNLKDLPFVFSKDDNELNGKIRAFNNDLYIIELNRMLEYENVLEDGIASNRVTDFIREKIYKGEKR